MSEGNTPKSVRIAVVDQPNCVGCRVCARVCPANAISFSPRAVIDALTCKGCGACVSACPAQVIHMEAVG